MKRGTLTITKAYTPPQKFGKKKKPRDTHESSPTSIGDCLWVGKLAGMLVCADAAATPWEGARRKSA
tara:strand:+ start:161 stop:361 length:201 start_codon:yes stop_codon:yes gene_type:complete